MEHLEVVEPTLFESVGLLLFVIPEPAASALGVGLVPFGIPWWIQEWQ